MFHVPRLGKYPFLETLSLPIRCVSRSKNTRAASITLRKSSSRTYYGNGCESPSPDDGSMQLITNIIREAKPSPSSKRIKLGQDLPFVMFKEEKRQANKVHHSHAWNDNQVCYSFILLQVEHCYQIGDLFLYLRRFMIEELLNWDNKCFL